MQVSFILKDHKQLFWVFWGTFEAIIWSTIIVGYLSIPSQIPRIFNRFLSFGGRLSYSFYLWHALIIVVVERYIGLWSPFTILSLNVLLNLVIALILTLGFALLSYKTIEEPFLGMRKRYLN